MKKLASWLQEKYEIKNGEVKLKKKLEVKVLDELLTIPDDAIWVLAHASKGDKNTIVSCSPILKHSFVLSLKERFGVKFTDYNWIKYPDNQDLWGYVLVTTEKGTVGDGEVHKTTLQPSMRGFAYTFLKKRGEDRAVLLELGMYQQGLYSEVEVTPEMKNETSNYEELPKEGNRVLKMRGRIRKLNDYLNQSEDDLKKLVSGLTGQPVKNVDIDSMSVDKLAKTLNELEEISRVEFKKRMNLTKELLKIDKTLSSDELLATTSIDLQEKLEILSKGKE